ncbi:heparan sulfate glucosamine 3-O-sulfotransferase 1-like [Diadema antillarum]|uniref:heparan sulfate glucosamine 3-O-sulfotransferase 1-like n=1 Tax=Diadema antillarum TaxID=105358 RepID=UPI003A8A4B2E
MSEEEAMSLGLPAKCQRKVALTSRSAMGLLLFTLTLSLCLMVLSYPEAVPVQNQVVREVIPKEYLNTCHRRKADGTRALLPSKYLTMNDCAQRLPRAIVLGAKKCGTGALRVFLDTHPSVVFSKKAEPRYFTQNYHKGVDWYRETMRHTSPSQIGIEKSPGYLFSKQAAKRIKADLPSSTKLIVILCNPTRRTISDFTFEQLNAIKEKRKVGTEEAKVIARQTYRPNKFERAVLTSSGRIRTDLDIILHSMYDKFILTWLETFPRSRFLFVDGDNFTQNPVPVLNEIERFLDIPPYFNNSKFYFDEEKGFYCLSEPFRQCLKSTKGLEHPPVDKAVLRKLHQLFRAHDFTTSILTLKNFTWMRDGKGAPS